ncbi:SLC13 family permease [Sphingomonas oligoaromativorans]|uniref:SLC13 family permease n=1 Tax=Sphingomonas oligoaromativorans TaxID=575322 RepID=UPI0014237129|nr:SLC13 family permease [Sphingomonas oligoaromativorans]NIJ32809.1 di/tricarboxylate transporter [Sphingomonas oligoaromativorans]
MTLIQILSFALIGGAVAAFAWGRFRYDVISLVALLVGVAIGVVPAKQAFTGFTSDVIVVIASALVVSAGIARSGVIETAIRPLLSRLKSLSVQVPVLAGVTAILSMLTKNVGALAILMPTALKLGRSEGSSVSALLMPMSFMSLLGGLVTLVGTSTNIIVSQVREETIGKPFEMFDFAPVGLGLTLVGLVVVSICWRLLPRDRTGNAGLEEVAAAAIYTTEATIPDDLPEGLRTIADLDLEKGGVTLIAIERADGQRVSALPDRTLTPGEVLVLEGSDEELGQLFGRLPLKQARSEEKLETREKEEVRTVEAVIQPDSPLIGLSAQRARLQEEHGIKLLAVGRSSQRITKRLREVTLRAGDVLLVQAGEKALPPFLASQMLLPLAERAVRLGNRRQRFGPVLILAAAILLVALNVAPVAVAFFGAAVAIVVIGALPMREAYDALEPEVLVLIGALTPISEAVQHTGGTGLIAAGLAHLLAGAAPILVLGVLMVTAMACSPFLHNAPTVLVLGPIAVSVAQRLHLSPDAFLMAVATGAGCDFLTPIGHQCNTLVMGPGGYRFWDYGRLGLPLSIMVIAVGVPLIAWVWPLT